MRLARLWRESRLQFADESVWLRGVYNPGALAYADQRALNSVSWYVRVGLVSRVTLLRTAMHNCTRDEKAQTGQTGGAQISAEGGSLGAMTRAV